EYGSARWFGEITFSSVDRVLRLLGKPGQRIIGALRTRDIRKSEIYSDLRKKFLRDFLRSPEEVQEQVFRVLEGKSDGPISETVANMARKAREAMDEVATRLQEMGTQMRVVENTPDGPRVVIKPFQPLENYAPRLYDWKKILDKSHPLGFNPEVLEALVQSRQARDMAQAAQILREVRRGTLTNNPKAFFEYGRTVELPDKFLLPASVRAERWAQDVSAQLSLYEVFGGRLERLEDMKSVLGQSGIDPEVANYVNKALDHYLGTITPTRMSRLLSEVRSWNNIHKMMLSSIPNLA